MNVFISYRRADTQDLAGRIADRLRCVPGVTDVFLDVTGIAPGADFLERIEAALSRKPVCLVLIGTAWRGPRPDGKAPRLFDAHDAVRLEVGRMLTNRLRVLPALVGNATMPDPDDVPEELRPLVTLNAMRISFESFERDLAALTDIILSRTSIPAPATVMGRHALRTRSLRGVLSFLISLVALIVAAAVHNVVTGRSLEETLGDPGHVWLLILGVTTLGTLIGVFIR